MKNILLIFAIVASVSLTAKASWVVEPGVGYSGGGQLSYKFGGTTYTFNESGIIGDITISYIFGNGMYLGFEGNTTQSGTLAYSVGTTKNDTFYRNAGGLVFGWKSGRFDVNLGYMAIDNIYLTPDVANVNSPNALYGTGVGGRVGVDFAHGWSVNVMYYVPTYTTYDKGSTKGATIATTNYSSITDGAASLIFQYTFGGKK